MKKILNILLIILGFCVISGCLISCSSNNIETFTESETVEEENPVEVEELNYDIGKIYGISIPSKDYQPSFIDMGAYEWKYTTEKDFNNMKITFEKDVFEHDEIIKIKIENKNGLTFNLLSYPYVEYFNPEKQEWVRLAYYPDEYFFETRIGEECVKATLTFNPKYLLYKYEPGQYRFVLLCSNHPIYSDPITIK